MSTKVSAGRVITAAGALILVAAGILVWAALQRSDAAKPVTSPFDIPDRGARAGFAEHLVEYEAESGHTNAAVIGPDRTAKTAAGEASGRGAVALREVGDYVEFTLTKPANALTVRLSIPDSSDGRGQDATLSVYLAGAAAADLAVTSRYTWFYGGFPFSNDPAKGSPQHRYDSTRLMLDRTVPIGATVRLQKDADDVASEYIVDLLDAEEVPPPIAAPSGTLSVVDFGADPSGVADSADALDRAIAAGKAQRRDVYLPPGTYQANRHIVVDRVTLRGAGPWYSVLRGDGVGVYGRWPDDDGGSHQVILRDFAIFGEVAERDDEAQVNGVGGALGGGSVVENLWIQHTKVGMWLDGPFDGLTVTGNRVFSTTADGINLHRGVSHAVVTNNLIRGTGDDGLASWSDQDPNHDNAFRYNTVVAPLLANGIALYGGADNEVTDNVVADTHIEGAGIQVANRFSGTTFLDGTVAIARNTTLRAGSVFAGVQPQVGAVWLFAKDAPITAHVVLAGNELLDSTFSGLLLYGDAITDLTVDGLVADGSGTFAIQAQALGVGTFTGLSLTRSGVVDLYWCSELAFTIKGEQPGPAFCGPLPSPSYQFDGALPTHPPNPQDG